MRWAVTCAYALVVCTLVVLTDGAAIVKHSVVNVREPNVADDIVCYAGRDDGRQ